MPLKLLKTSAAAAVFFFFAAAGVLQAALSLDPQIIEIMIPAGKEHRGVYNITNNSDGEALVRIEPENWLKKRAPGSENAAIPLSDWFEIKPSSFTLEAGSSKEISYTVELPKLLEGEVIAMNFFAVEAPRGGITVRRRFGSALYAAAENTAEITCEITEVSISTDSLYVKVKNPGNVHIRPQGYILLVNEKEDITKKIELHRGAPVFPGGTHTLRASGYPSDFDKLPPGRYIAQPLINYGMVFDRNFSVKGEAVQMLIE